MLDLGVCTVCGAGEGAPCQTNPNWKPGPHMRAVLRWREQVRFAWWLLRLAIHAHRKCGYGVYVLQAGASAWWPMFEEDFTPRDAWAEEQSHWDTD